MKNREKLEELLNEYDNKVKLQLEAFNIAEQDSEERNNAYKMVHYWAAKANKIIKILYPLEYAEKCWDL